MRTAYLILFSAVVASLTPLPTFAEPPVVVADIPRSMESRAGERGPVPMPFTGSVPRLNTLPRTPLNDYRDEMRAKFANRGASDSKPRSVSSNVSSPATGTHRNFTSKSSPVQPASFQEAVMAEPMTMPATRTITAGSSTLESNCASRACSSDTWNPLPTFEPGTTGFAYYFRPYQFSDVALQQSAAFVTDRSNPYDNRFFENFYTANGEP